MVKWEGLNFGTIGLVLTASTALLTLALLPHRNDGDETLLLENEHPEEEEGHAHGKILEKCQWLCL